MPVSGQSCTEQASTSDGSVVLPVWAVLLGKETRSFEQLYRKRETLSGTLNRLLKIPENHVVGRLEDPCWGWGPGEAKTERWVDAVTLLAGPLEEGEQDVKLLVLRILLSNSYIPELHIVYLQLDKC